MLEVKLSWYELSQAALIGARRNIEALQKGLRNQHGLEDGDDWTKHVEGAAGEMAFAKGTNRFWSGSVNTFKLGGDVGDIQVRTRSRDHYDLIVRDKDRDTDAFVLVLGVAPNYKIAGWIYGHEARKPEWRQDYGNRPPAYFVPQVALHPIESLPR